jgi:aspartate 1-decarboxylase
VQTCMLKGKIHGGVVTDANVEYEGSITIDAALMKAARILTHEQVQVWSLTSGARLATYAIPGAAGSGEICINGAAAHRIKKGEVVIIATFAWMDDKEAVKYEPAVVFVDSRNRIREERGELRAVSVR